MIYGIHVFPTEHSIQPAELARAAEERGLDSVWFSEHSHIPAAFLAASDPAARLPDYYWQAYDLFVAMTLAAAATTKIKVAPGVALVVERDPIFFAKEVATLDRVSNGRLILGAGVGWLAPEMANHGVEYRTRYSRFKEHIQALKAIWSEDEPEFHGRFIQFERIKAEPRPLQRPHPPIILGGSGGKAIETAAAICDGWAPWFMPWAQMRPAVAQLRQQAAASGRDPDALEISLFEKQLPDPKTLAEMETAGVKRIILTIFAHNREAALPVLDALGEAARKP